MSEQEPFINYYEDEKRKQRNKWFWFNFIFTVIMAFLIIAALVAVIHGITSHNCTIWGAPYQEWQDGHNVTIRRCIW